MKLVTLDFESYYAVGYSLKSPTLSMSEYVTDPRFIAHMVGIKEGDAPTTWHAYEDIEPALRAIDWTDVMLVCHNTHFDGFVLSNRYGITAPFYVDTMLLSKAVYGPSAGHSLDAVAGRLMLGGKLAGRLEDTKGKERLTPEELQSLGVYCVNDVELTYEAFQALRPRVPDEEVVLMDITIKMFVNPVLQVDEQRAAAARDAEITLKIEKLLLCGASKDELMSNDKFVAVLTRMGVTAPLKLSKTTGLVTPALAKSDPGFIALLNHSRADVRLLAEARLAVKSTLGETRAVRMLQRVEDGRALPILLNWGGAHTYRWSGGDKFNAQNFTRGGELRKSILAPPGYHICTSDSAQIELRTNLWWNQDEDKLDVLRDFDAGVGPDLYRVTAAMVLNKAVEQIGPKSDERQFGKVLALALGFGMGARALKVYCATPAGGSFELDNAEYYVERWRDANQPIVEGWAACEEMLGQMIDGVPNHYMGTDTEKDALRLPNGLALHYDRLHGYKRVIGVGMNARAVYSGCTYYERQLRKNIYGGLFLENIVQALARIVVASQMVKIAERYRVVMMSHDEISWIAPAAEAEEACEWGRRIMCTPPWWAPDIPLNAEAQHGIFYQK